VRPDPKPGNKTLAGLARASPWMTAHPGAPVFPDLQKAYTNPSRWAFLLRWEVQGQATQAWYIYDPAVTDPQATKRDVRASPSPPPDLVVC
jgi:hypothetical protein